MNVTQVVKKQVQETADGSLLAVQDFPVPLVRRISLEKALSDLYTAGVLGRVAKGLYYKPQPSIFGALPPSTSRLLGKLLSLYKNSVSYLTGLPAYTALGLTTQVSTEYTICSDQPRSSPIVFGPTTIRFTSAYVKEEVTDIVLLHILDAVRDLEEIPATTPQEASVALRAIIRSLSQTRQRNLVRLCLAYPPSVRAFMGVVFESLGKKTLAKTLRNSLNPTSKYRIKLDKAVFSNYAQWSIR